MRVAAAAAHFGRDLDAALHRIEAILRHARRAGCRLVVLPHAALGGPLDAPQPRSTDLPPLLTLEHPVFAALRELAGDLVVCIGFTERAGAKRYQTAVCLHGDGILGTHRKVHLLAAESAWYSPGEDFNAFETPIGRLGMLLDYDKTFPESARSLAVDGADIVAALSAWPASATQRTSQLTSDRQTRLFDLYDMARGAENQLFVVSANLTGNFGELRFLGHAKVVDPIGQQLARTGPKAGLATADIDLAELAAVRRGRPHIEERRLDAYRYAAGPASTDALHQLSG